MASTADLPNTYSALENGRQKYSGSAPLARSGEISPGPVKAALAIMGKIEETYRLPIVPVTPETKEKLRAVLVDLRLI